MDNTFYKVDLHVHTPASKCYKGEKTETEYWDILKNAVDKGIRLMAITDHNTLEGYSQFIKLKEDTLNEYSIVQKYNIPKEQREDIESKKRLFDNVCIVLGVEITLNPGVHIIVLSPDDNLKEMDELLNEVGYTADKRGRDSEFAPDMDVKTFFENPKLEGKIIFAPHVDSDKGIWNSIEGMYRANIFQSDRLNAISCNNSKQLKKIKNNIKVQPDYSRKRPLAYINASDAHTSKDIGSKYSYFELKEISFNGLKNAFTTPESSINDIGRPDFKVFVNRCTENYKSVYLDQMDDLPQALCAILNNRVGCILLGISDDNDFVGIEVNEDDLKRKLESSIKEISASNPKTARIETTMRVEQLGNGKSSAIIVIRDNGYCLWTIDQNEVYVLDSETKVKIASVKEIELLVKENIISELSAFNKTNNDNIKISIRKLKQATDPISKYVLFDKLQSQGNYLSHYFDIIPIQKMTISNMSIFSSDNMNGLVNGNVYYAVSSEPRLPYAYLRYSCAVYEETESNNLQKLYKLVGDSIVFTSKGGCHLITEPSDYYFDSYTTGVILKPNENFYKNNYSIYNAMAWLKSDYFIWLWLVKYGNMNVNTYDNKIWNEFILPVNICKNQNIEIEEAVKAIISKEKEYIAESKKFAKNDSDEKNELCDTHNANVSQIAFKIEQIIKEKLQLIDEDVKMVLEDLSSGKIFNKSYCNNF